jgi:hypothetical protein
MKGSDQSTLGTVLLVVIVGCGIYFSVRSRQMLKKCSFPNNAIVLYTDKRLKKRSSVHYEYTVEGKRHKSSELLPENTRRSDFPVGKKIKVIVACQDHDISKIDPTNE